MVAGCFLLSGFAALLYETVWLRQFSIYFGTSEQVLAIVLGTYMGGLALGSLIAARVANQSAPTAADVRASGVGNRADGVASSILACDGPKNPDPDFWRGLTSRRRQENWIRFCFRL